MRAKSGRWWTFFSVFVLAGVFLTWQPAWALTITDPTGIVEKETNEDEFFEFTPEVTEAVGTVQFSIQADEELPGWLNFNQNTGILTGTPGNSDVGIITNIVISAGDNTGTASLEPFNLEVINVNDDPTIRGTPLTNVNQDERYSFQPSANDIDVNDTLEFNITAKPDWATFDPETGLLEGTPTNDDVGNYTGIIIGVSDGTVQVDLPEFEIIVDNVNDRPEINLDTLPEAEVNQGAQYTYTISADDIDAGDTPENLVYTVENLPGWLTFDAAATPQISNAQTTEGELRPLNGDVGVYSDIVLKVTDAAGASDTYTFSIEVINVNDDPTISGDPELEVVQGSPYSFRPFAHDIDLDIGIPQDLNFSIDSTSHPYPSEWPVWLTFDPETGELSGTPGNDDVGEIQGIELTVFDGPEDDPDTLSATLQLEDDTGTAIPFNLNIKNKNDAPEISLPQSVIDNGFVAETQQGGALNMEIKASDIDSVHSDVSLSFNIQNKPEWVTTQVSADGFTYKLVGTPTNSDVGTYSGIVVTVNDGKAIAETERFSIQVANKNDAPTISAPVPPEETVKQDAVYKFSPVVNDVDLAIDDQEKLSLAISSTTPETLPSWLDFVNNTEHPLYVEDPLTYPLGTLTGTPSNKDVGVIEGIQISVKDDEGLSAKTPLEPFNIEVVNVNDNPVLSGKAQPKVPFAADQTSTTFSFSPTVIDPDKDIPGTTDTFSYFVFNAPRWMEWTETNETLTITNRAGRPNKDDVNTYTFQITVFDGNEGSDTESFTVQVIDSETLNIPTGDFNGNGKTDLTDAIMALQLLTGITFDDYIWIMADPNEDQKVGLEDVIYILDHVATP